MNISKTSTSASNFDAGKIIKQCQSKTPYIKKKNNSSNNKPKVDIGSQL